MGKTAARASSIVGPFFLLPWQGYGAGSVGPDVCPLVREAARALLAALREDATSVIVCPPPLQMGQEVWSGLRRGPGATSQRGYSVSNGQIDPLNIGSVQPSREA